MKYFLIIIFALTNYTIYSQVGINTTSPTNTLDLKWRFKSKNSKHQF